MATYSSSINMARCLLDPLVGLKDGDYSPQHVGHMIGDVFHYKGVPSARRVGDLVLVRTVPYGMRPGHYLPSPPYNMWAEQVSDPNDPAYPAVRYSSSIYQPKAETLFVQNLNPESVAIEAKTYEESLLVYLTESVAGKFGRTRFARTHRLQQWFGVLAHNRSKVGMPEISAEELKVRFASSVATRQFAHPDYDDLDWKEILQ